MVATDVILLGHCSASSLDVRINLDVITSPLDVITSVVTICSKVYFQPMGASNYILQYKKCAINSSNLKYLLIP